MVSVQRRPIDDQSRDPAIGCGPRSQGHRQFATLAKQITLSPAAGPLAALAARLGPKNARGSHTSNHPSATRRTPPRLVKTAFPDTPGPSVRRPNKVPILIMPCSARLTCDGELERVHRCFPKNGWTERPVFRWISRLQRVAPQSAMSVPNRSGPSAPYDPRSASKPHVTETKVTRGATHGMLGYRSSSMRVAITQVMMSPVTGEVLCASRIGPEPRQTASVVIP